MSLFPVKGHIQKRYFKQRPPARSPPARSSTPGQTLVSTIHGSYWLPPGVTPEQWRSQTEPEVVDPPGPVPDPESVLKAEKKKAERKRYKAKKKAEAAAKRQAEKEAEEAAEASELSKSQAELQAEEDAKLGEKRLKKQAARQERFEKAASLVNPK